jgi:hypothetical protein
MKFLFYTIYVILISLINISVSNAVAFAINAFYFCFISLILTICLLIYLKYLTKVFLKKLLLATVYLPIIIFIVFKVSVFLTEFF